MIYLKIRSIMKNIIRKKLILKQSWGLSSLLIILLMYACSQKRNLYSQDCNINVTDKNPSELEYLGLDTIVLKHEYVIILVSISDNKYSYFKMFGDSIFFIEKGNHLGIDYKRKIKLSQDDFDEALIQDKIYIIHSNRISCHYLDALIIKKQEKIAYFIPTGSNVFDNYECIIKNNKNLKGILKKFRKLYYSIPNHP